MEKLDDTILDNEYRISDNAYLAFHIQFIALIIFALSITIFIVYHLIERPHITSLVSLLIMLAFVCYPLIISYKQSTILKKEISKTDAIQFLKRQFNLKLYFLLAIPAYCILTISVVYFIKEVLYKVF